MFRFVLSFFLCLALHVGWAQKQNAASPELDSLLALINEEITLAQRQKLEIQVAEQYLTFAPEKSLSYAQLSLEKAQNLKNSLEIARSYRILGKAFYNQGIFTKAIDYYLKALKENGLQADPLSLADTYQDLGLAYQYSKQNELVYQYYQKALELYQELDHPEGEAQTLGYIGHYYEKEGEDDQALEYQKQSLHLFLNSGKRPGLGVIYDNIGSIYEDREEYDTAFYYFKKALENNRQENNQIEMIVNLNNIGDTYRKRKNFDKALEYSLQSLELARSLNQNYQIRSSLRDLSKIYADKGDYQKAHEYLEESYERYQEIFNEENARQLARMKSLYDIQEKDKEIQLLEKDKRLQRIMLLSSLGGLFLLIGLTLVIISRQRLKIQTNREIIEQNERIHQSHKELTEAELLNTQLREQKLQAELENNQLKEQKLQAELELRNKELSSHTLRIIQRNEMLLELKEKMQAILRKSNAENSREIKQMLSSIDYNFSLDKDWQDFQKIYEQVHQDFFNSLQRQFPDLTAGEIRLCALMRLNLNSQDIAAVLGISSDSLRTTRYRLRKKMNLPKGRNLASHIMSL